MNVEELMQVAQEQLESTRGLKHCIYVCNGSGCLAMRADEVTKALQQAVAEKGLEASVEVRPGGCQGLCSRGPMVAADSTLLQNVTPAHAAEIIEHLDDTLPEALVVSPDEPFFARQKRLVLQDRGLLHPERLDHYLGAGGYKALLKALYEMTPAEVLQEVVKSGLRGRGGAGYPTGLKWTTVAKATDPIKYVVCNGDEGDPGAFMDRSVMEDYSYRLIEGMTIAAYAVGARSGYLYVRAEYPLAVKRLQNAIKQATKAGLLGTEIAGTPFQFNVEVRLGAGAFVCGEETALLASIEGRRGTPRPRPPYPAEAGLWGKPTLINNVETIANIPRIIEHGSAWFAEIGTDKSKGTKVFALSGRINNSGLIEVPMGITLRDIIFAIGGGIPGGKQFKAVQTGGPSGGCISAEYLDMPVDYESLAKVGSIMGSGGMIVMDETSCMVDVAKYFMEFCMSESCGKCVPCRVGTAQMYSLLCKICDGAATLDDLALLERLCDVVKHTSLCGLGQAAPNPVLSTLRYFRHEYLAHIVDKHCPAGVCACNKQLQGAAQPANLEVTA